MAYRSQADAYELLAYEQAREAEGWAPLAGYTDCNGNQFESYDEACRYYGVDTPAQVAAEEAYYAELEEAEHFARLANDALVFTVADVPFVLRGAELDRRGLEFAAGQLADDDFPF